MKRPISSDSLALDANGGGFLEEELGCEAEEEAELSSQVKAGEKKRRLSVEQVKALEKNFEVENKLEPERKVKLAMELGLQPRQVAVWFQNRRARWKTKQLERDYTILKSNYDSLKLSYDSLRGDKDALLAEIRELKLKLGMAKDEPLLPEEKNPIKEESEEPPELIYNYKDGSSDSDSSAIVNGDRSPNSFAVSGGHGLREEEREGLFMGFGHYPLEKTGGGGGRLGFCYFPQQQLTAEDHMLGAEEPCSAAFFSDEPPAMPWYCSDEQWS